jgi:hypothetical protein
MRGTVHRLLRRTGVVTLIAGSAVAAGSMAEASVGWSLYDYYGGNLVASGSGSVLYSGSQVEQTSRYQDRRAEGYGAYTQANFQPFEHSCYPDPAICHWEWGGVTTRQTRRIGTADGVVYGLGAVTRDWPTNRDYAQVCIDIRVHVDPCSTSAEMYP